MPHHLLEGICDDLLGDATRRVYRLHATYIQLDMLQLWSAHASLGSRKSRYSMNRSCVISRRLLGFWAGSLPSNVAMARFPNSLAPACEIRN